MNFIRRLIIFILGILSLVGLNWVYNPRIDDTEEYWDIEAEVNQAKLEADKIQERIDEKKKQD